MKAYVFSSIFIMSCLFTFGQKLNIISMSGVVETSKFPLGTGSPMASPDIIVVPLDSVVLVFNRTFEGKSIYRTIDLASWDYSLDPYVLNTLDYHHKTDTFVETLNSIFQKSQIPPQIDTVKIYSAFEIKTEKSLLIPEIPSTLDPEHYQLPQVKTPLRDVKIQDSSVKSMPILNFNGQYQIVQDNILFGGNGLHGNYTTLNAKYDTLFAKGTFSLSGWKTKMGDTIQKVIKYTFSDPPGTLSYMSAYQAVVGINGDLVFIQNRYSTEDLYFGSDLVHIDNEGIEVNRIPLGFYSNENSSLIDFINDSIVHILGFAGSSFYHAFYDLNSKIYDLKAQTLTLSRKVNYKGVSESKLDQPIISHAIGYKKSESGYYIFGGTTDKLKIPIPSKEQSKIERNYAKLFIIKLDSNLKVEWTQSIEFNEISINDIGQGSEFPILLNIHDKKWVKRVYGSGESNYRQIGCPAMAYITKDGIQYVDNSYDLLSKGYLMMSGCCKINDNEYYGLAARVIGTGKEYSHLTYSYRVVAWVDWHVIYFELN